MGSCVLKKVCLIIMDGWGVSAHTEADATKAAATPNIDRLTSEYPSTTIAASGYEVGLPDGQMGNSEVGHLTIGAGRVTFQELTRISRAAEDGSLATNAELVALFGSAKKTGGALHLMGLLSDGGVHSHIDHLKAIIKGAVEAGVKTVLIHAFLDGRDTPPKSGAGYVQELEDFIEEIKARETVRIATVSGRYYAMDRDNRWERVERAYGAIVSAEGERAATAARAVEAAYARGETDEFVSPTVVTSSTYSGMEEGDAVLFFNFRSDRGRELCTAITSHSFEGFKRGRTVNVTRFATMTPYGGGLELPVLFSSEPISNKLSDVLSAENVTQFRVSETEKYAHVTFFFNGGVESPAVGEERKLIESVKEVPTYDLAPKMRAAEIAEAAIEKINTGEAGFVLMNFANGDMVGHTGFMAAAVEGCEAVDAGVGAVVDAALKQKYATIIIADHGNAEQMVDYETGAPHTAHTSNPVPLILIDPDLKGKELKEGCGLCDVAPTVLKLMGIEKPGEMTGESVY
ncbi:MAG: 2,3-bisphosphoglycerate-independent phosphoglycerate mutase [Proteobacteria bacterium]|nr:2,3-bisphosphoglycerate-independent phosphoglycerate mutase [Pseudomonadota bacterium]